MPDVVTLLDRAAYTAFVKTLDSPQREAFSEHVRQLQQLATTTTTPSAFLSEFAQRTADLFAASTVAIWFPTASFPQQLTQPKVAVGWNNMRLDAQTEIRHRVVLEYALQHQAPLAVQPYAKPGRDCESANPTDACLLLAPIVNPQRESMAVLEIGLGPKPLRRPHQALTSAYVEWLQFLGHLLSDGIQRTITQALKPQPRGPEIIAMARERVGRVKEQLRVELESTLHALAGQNWGSLAENREMAQQVHALLESVGLRVKCRECGEAAILRCQKAGNSKTGVFVYDHYLDKGRTFHGGQTTFPELALLPKPARRKKA